METQHRSNISLTGIPPEKSKESAMDKPLDHPEGMQNYPNLINQLLIILLFTGGIAVLATALTYLMAVLLKL